MATPLGTDETGRISPPAALIRRLQALQNPRDPAVVIYPQSHATISATKKFPGLSENDLRIAERLEKLREPQKHHVSDAELQERLNRLKGAQRQESSGQSSPAQSSSSQPFYVKPDTRNDVQKADDLMKQMHEEAALDPVQGIGSDEEDYDSCLDSDSYSDDDDEHVDRLIKRTMKEVDEDEQLALEGDAKDEEIIKRLQQLRDVPSDSGASGSKPK